MTVRVHFLNVGHGDSTIIEHASGRLSLININSGSALDPESAKELAKTFSLSETVIQRAAPAPRTLCDESGAGAVANHSFISSRLNETYDSCVHVEKSLGDPLIQPIDRGTRPPAGARMVGGSPERRVRWLL
jgi:hypothetical protein